MKSNSDLHSIHTITFSRLELNPDLPPEVFQFSIPTGTMQDEGPDTGYGPDAVNGIYRPQIHVSYPRLVSKTEPTYTSEASQLKISGLVLISLAVTSDGSPIDMKVVRGLGHGLDEKAVEAVKVWRFAPGMKDGVPVAVGPVTVAVNFQLP